MPVSYVLPIRSHEPAAAALTAYVRSLSAVCEVLIVDGSSPTVFAAHAAVWANVAIHLSVDPDLAGMPNGKVAGVITGVRRASHEHVIIADDDVRYDAESLAAVTAALGAARCCASTELLRSLALACRNGHCTGPAKPRQRR